jgi:hypothetical protein
MSQLDLQPVEIVVLQDHAFKKKPPRTVIERSLERKVQPPGCAVCNQGRLAAAHLGAPPSMNSGNHSMHPQAYQALKHAWQHAFTERLAATSLPRPCGRIVVEGQVGFPTLAHRDQGNYRWMIEKALGDALVAGGWLLDDRFYPDSLYEFGGLTGRHDRGRSWTRLFLFPTSMAAMEAAA